MRIDRPVSVLSDQGDNKAKRAYRIFHVYPIMRMWANNRCHCDTHRSKKISMRTDFWPSAAYVLLHIGQVNPLVTRGSAWGIVSSHAPVILPALIHVARTYTYMCDIECPNTRTFDHWRESGRRHIGRERGFVYAGYIYLKTRNT